MEMCAGWPTTSRPGVGPPVLALDAMVQHGLAHPADIDQMQCDNAGMYAVHLAFKAKNLETIKWLKNHNCIMTLQTYVRYTGRDGTSLGPVSAASIAVQLDFKEGVEYLCSEVPGGTELFLDRAVMKWRGKTRMISPITFARGKKAVGRSNILDVIMPHVLRMRRPWTEWKDPALDSVEDTVAA